MTGGLIALIAALAVATAAGAILRRRAGKVSHSPPVPGAGAHDGVLTSEDLRSPLGERATLVQFSTEYCAYCGPTREALREIAADAGGVAVVEIDAAGRMDLTKRLSVFTTPTVLVLGPDGAIAARASGRPRKAELTEAVRELLGDGVRF